MDSLSPAIPAVPIAASGAAFPEGAGRVERQLSADTFVIAVGREQITVQAAGGELREGMQVVVRERNGTMLIQPVDKGQADPGPAVRADTFSLNATVAEALDAAASALAEPSPRAADYQRTAAILNAVMPRLTGTDRELAEKLVKLLDTLELGNAASRGLDSDAEVRSLLAQLRDSVAAGNAVSTRIVTIPGTPGNALFSFANLDDALDYFTISPDSPGLPAVAASGPASDGPVSIRSVSSPDGASSVKVLLPGELGAEIDTLRSGFESGLFRSMPDEVFRQVLGNAGRLDFGLLQQIDSLASQLQLPARTGMSDEQAQAVAHWLQTVLETDAPSPELAARTPATMPDLLRDLAGLVGLTPGSTEMPGPDSLFPDAAEICGQGSQAGFLSLFFDRVGLGLEHSMLSSGTPDIAGLKSRLLQLVQTLDSAPGGRGEPLSESAASPSALKQQLESALAKIESLQLLARPIETAGGQEQIFSLPVKLDGSWTPLQVRFLKKRQQEKGSGRGRSYGVFINVEPSGLGNVTAHIDYSPRKAATVSIAFERNTVRRWFEERLPEIRQSLQAAGIPAPQISLSLIRRNRALGSRGASAGTPAILDVKA